jgi:hypothetical protein
LENEYRTTECFRGQDFDFVRLKEKMPSSLEMETQKGENWWLVVEFLKTYSTFAIPKSKGIGLYCFLLTIGIKVLSDGVTGNTPDFDSGKSRFEPWSDN